MKTKLTLSVEKDLVRYAHHQARRDGQSVSAMFSAYLRRRQVQMARKATPSATSMLGTLKQYPVDDSKQRVRDAYAKKYTH